MFKKLHLGTVSFGTESFPEVKEHLTSEYAAGTRQGSKVNTRKYLVKDFKCFTIKYFGFQLLFLEFINARKCFVTADMSPPGP